MYKEFKQPFCHVFVANFIDGVETQKVSSNARNLELESVTNKKVKLQKYEVWKLLEHAVKTSLGLSANAVDFYKGDNGKWHAHGFYFSLSHSHGALAVAVSSSPVGVDIELIKQPKPNAVERVLTTTEKGAISRLSESERAKALITLWSQKESVFKRNGSGRLSEIQTDKESVETKIINLSGSDYALSTSCDETKIEYFESVDFIK